MRIKWMIALWLVSFVSASAQKATTPADSASAKKNRRAIKPVTYIVPAVMVTYGFIALESKPLIHFNQNIKQTIWDNHPHQTTSIDDYLWVAPVASVYALNLAGIKGKHNFADRTALYFFSTAIATAFVLPTKRLTNELRPDGSNRLSFPSGHTSQSFVSAEFLRMEYKDVSPWYGIAGYAVAATTGYLRMYNNKHWFSDVVAGAGVGILSVQAAYWIYPKLKQKFIKNKKSTALIVPFYQEKQAGLYCTIQIR